MFGMNNDRLIRVHGTVIGYWGDKRGDVSAAFRYSQLARYAFYQDAKRRTLLSMRWDQEVVLVLGTPEAQQAIFEAIEHWPDGAKELKISVDRAGIESVWVQLSPR
jgi:hypothetical protein